MFTKLLCVYLGFFLYALFLSAAVKTLYIYAESTSTHTVTLYKPFFLMHIYTHYTSTEREITYTQTHTQPNGSPTLN